MLQSFTAWLLSFFEVVLVKFYNLGIDFLQSVSDSLADFVREVVSLLPAGVAPPPAPLTPVGATFDIFLQCLNWLFPVSYLVQLVTWSVAGMLIYIAVAPLARWVKALN